jgi:phosphate transport system substrate-binding protein
MAPALLTESGFRMTIRTVYVSFSLAMLGAWVWVSPVVAETLSGAGSSAAAPVYRAWAAAYGRTLDFQLSYDPAGSSAGLKSIKSRQVAFGATDVAPSAQQLTEDGLILVPTFITGAVPVVNLPKAGGGKLRLSGEVLAGIFSGSISRWNAPEIQNLNPGVGMPEIAIKPVVRSDGSGTTYYFTDYLSRISPVWKEKFGARTTIAWPAIATGAKGSDGVVKAVKATPGSIGYVDFNYVAEHGLTSVYLRNAAGEYVAPGVDSFRAALQASEWRTKADFHASLTNLPGRNSWPITMGTFVLLPKVSDKSEETARALRYFVWALLKGDQVIEGMAFVRLPDGLQAQAYKALSSVIDKQGRSLGVEALATLSK